jgi:outer membrane protein, multidrug efflux system
MTLRPTKTSARAVEMLALAGVLFLSPALADPTEVPATVQEPAPSAQPSDPLLEPIAPAARNIRRWREAIALVRANSTDLGQAEKSILLARAESRAALAQALPILTLTSQAQHHLLTGQGVDQNGNPVSLPNPQTIFSAGTTLNAPVFDLGAWYDITTSKHEIKRNELNYQNAERVVITGLADALVAVVTSERLAEVSRVSLGAALETLELTRRRADLGVGIMLDVLRVEQEVARSKSQVVSANESVASARDALGLALGLSEAVGVEQDLNLDALRVDARATCTRHQDPRSRADWLTAAAAETIAERNVSRVLRNFFPTVTVGSTLNYNAFARFSPNGDNTTWTIGAVLNYSLYDGGARYADKRAKSARKESATLARVDLERRIEVEVRKAERSVHVAEAGLKISQERRDAAHKASNLAQFKFTNGSGSAFDVVDALQNKREAELDVTIKEFTLVQAQVAAFLALASCDI